MRVSCSIRAHPARADLVVKLVDRLGIDGDRVTWDRHGDSWETGARAWAAFDPDADWHLVLEDDAIVCRDLLPALEVALDQVPAHSVVSLYTGGQSGARNIPRAVARATEAGASWVWSETLIWGVAIALPVASIPAMLQACDGRGTPYDTRIANYYVQRRWPAYYPCPPLVDHADVPSLLGHSPGRRAVTHIGADVSAWDFDPAGEVMAARPRRASKQKEKAMSLLVAKTSAVVRYKDRRTVIQKDVTTAEAGADIVRAFPNLWAEMGVDYPAARAAPVEEATAAPGEKRDIGMRASGGKVNEPEAQMVGDPEGEQVVQAPKSTASRKRKS